MNNVSFGSVYLMSEFKIIILLGICLVVAIIVFAFGGGMHGKDD